MTMNRAARRALKRDLKQQANRLAHPVPDSVTLRGGPMDGWVVTPDAPALQADWYTTWPPKISAAWQPGRYVLGPEERLRTAHWANGVEL